jgi:hypothetical protein
LPNAGARTLRPDDDPGWGAYAQTILHVQGHPPIDIDLAHAVSATQRVALSDHGLEGPFGVMTPCNPYGHMAAPGDNAARMTRFLAGLDAAGKRYIRVDGRSPDGRHVETGVALAWSQADVVALARKWQQSAIYWWDGSAVWVIGALTRSRPWRLGAAR